MSEKRVFDPQATWAPLEERMAQESDPRRRQLLEQVRNHMRTEIRGELADLMATLVDEPVYHFWGIEMPAPAGREAVEAFYTQMIATGGNRFHFDIRRIVVDENAVVTEGRMKQCVPGSALAASGIQEVDGEPVDPAATYLAESQILTVWPADADGRIKGEDIYFGSPMLGQVSRL